MTTSYLKIRRRIRDLVAVFLAIIIIALVFSVYSNYQQKTGELFKEGSSHARIIAEHASRTFGEVDRVLDIVINKVLTPEKLPHINEKELYDTFLAAQKGTPQIVSLYFVDAEGVLSASTLKYPIKRIDLSDREFFRHHRDTPGDTPYISLPNKNRISQKWSFVFSQRISRPDGSFFGIIGASLEMGYFESLYADLFDNTSRVVSLVRDDGFPVVMFPPQEKAFSVSLKDSSMFHSRLPRKPNDVYREKEGGSIDVERLIAYCRLPANYPLVARISYDWDEALAVWKRYTLVKTVLAIMLSGLAIVLTRLLMRRLYELERSEEQRSLMALIVDQSPVSVVITNPEAIISYVNPRFESLTGYSSQEAIGENPRILKTDITSPEIITEMWARLSSGQEWSGELCNKKKDGSLYWEMAHLFPVIGNNGAITHFAAVKEDITERKQFEEELQRAKKVAEMANSAKSEFLASMSHEIRTPINAITGMAYLTLQTDLDVRQRDYVRKLLSAAESLLGIINNILDFSKIEAGKLDLESVPFDLPVVLDHVNNIIAVRAEEKGLELEITLSPDVPRTLVGDPLRLRQILINLAGNAVKFTEHGKVVVAVVPARRTHIPGRFILTFSVIDTGIGMDDEQIGRIFAPFSQVDSSIARRYGGTGLGLSIVKRLVDLMGGTLEVVSHPDQGSRFSFTIEFGEASEGILKAGAVPYSSRPERQRAGLENIKGSRILLVEDNPINQQVACEIMHQVGMVVEVAASGREALEVLGSGCGFDLVFMDIQLPDMDGFEITRLIRKQWSIETLPVVAMTAHALAEERENCLAAGMNGHVTKPVNPHELYESLVRWIRPRDPDDKEAAVDAPDEDYIFPSSLPGINVPMVLKRIGGNGRLLRDLLVAFSEQHQNSVAEMRLAMEAHDMEQVSRIVHNLKGVSANLGADSIYALTRAIEDALQGNHGDGLPSILDQLEQAMDGVLVSVRMLDSSRAGKTAGVQPETEISLGKDALAQRLNALAVLLRHNKAAATKQLKELSPHLPASPTLSALEEQIKSLDFKKGLVSLKQLAEELHVHLEEQP